MTISHVTCGHRVLNKVSVVNWVSDLKTIKYSVHQYITIVNLIIAYNRGLPIYRRMREWCHLYAILIEILQQNSFQYISIICSCSFKYTLRQLRHISYVWFYIHNLLQLIAVLIVLSPAIGHAVYHRASTERQKHAHTVCDVLNYLF